MNLKRYSLLFIAIFTLLSCDSTKYRDQTRKVKWTKKDDIGQEITLLQAPRKVMSFSPALTEILFAICSDEQIVAVSPVCNFPDRVKSKPIVSNYPVDQEAVLSISPDLIFSEDGITPIDVAEQLKSLGKPVYFQKYHSVLDLLNKIDSIGAWLGRSEQAKYLTDSLKKEIQSIKGQQPTSHLPKVLVITWQQPIFAYGKNTLMTDKIRLAGGKNAVDEVFDKNYPELTREYILKINPDILFGGTFSKMDSTFFQLYPELKEISAYKNKHIYALTDDLATRPSPRVLESVREIKRFLDLYYQTKLTKKHVH